MCLACPGADVSESESFQMARCIQMDPAEECGTCMYVTHI